MVVKKNTWIVVERGVLGSATGKTANIVVQKNNVIRVAKIPKNKK